MRSPEQTHRVRQGECLASIARTYGFEDPNEIYQHAKNADLRRLRPNPNILYPGDTVVVPAHELKSFVLQTGMRHRITVQVPKRLLRIADCQLHSPRYDNYIAPLLSGIVIAA
jgi:N-acetylmuramoyl-L-alanine amidase